MLGEPISRPRLAVVAACLLAVMVAWSLSTARYGGPDEPAHILRAASVASGDLLGRPIAGLDPGYRSVEVADALTTGDPTCYRHDDDIAATCARADPDANGTSRAGSSAGTYPPAYYALVGVPVRWFGDVGDVLWYRFVAAGWCALVMTLVVARARSRGAIMVLAAVMPAAWFLFGVVNPNSLEIALVTLAWVGVERIRSDPSPSAGVDAAWVAAPIAIAIVIRPVAAIAWVAMVAALVVIRRDRRRGSGSVDPAPSGTARTRWILYGVPVAAIVAAALWNVWAGVAVSDARTAESASVLSSIRRSVDDATETWREMAGSLGWLEFSAPWIAHLTWWALFAVAAWTALRGGAALRRAWTWVLASLVAGPVVFEAVFAGRVGFIWQGRYSIPTGVGLLVLGIGARVERADSAERAGRRRRLPLLAGAAIVVHAATVWAVLQRYTVGAHGSWWFRGARWHPPVPALLLLTVDVIAMTALLTSLGAFGDLPADDVEGRTGLEPLDLLGAERVHSLEVDR